MLAVPHNMNSKYNSSWLGQATQKQTQILEWNNSLNPKTHERQIVIFGGKTRYWKIKMSF